MELSTRPPHPSPSIREDCWSQEATATLIEAWGQRYVDLKRGNLRRKDWQDVSDAVNDRHGHIKKARRTDVQCKNRIDTIKKKYKSEKARISESTTSSPSTWPFFDRLDDLIGPSVAWKKPSSYPMTPEVPIVRQKRTASEVRDFRKNYSAIAAAAAAVDSESEESNDSMSRSGEDSDGMGRVAHAIARFGEIYQRVEGEKQRMMVELEKQRLQFARDLEFQRMQMFMDTQVQIEKMKRSRGSGSNGNEDIYS